MTDPATKTELLERTRSEHLRLEAALTGISEEDMLRPGVVGAWSIKDILAHISDWEQRFLSWYRAGQRGEVPERPEPGLTWDDIDLLNQRIYDRHRLRTLPDVQAGFDDSYRELITAVDAMSEDELFTVGRFAWTRDYPLLVYLRANADEHYAEHADQIEAWRRA
ncbi:MAG TPA: ClbS/DfsB family four-helix bundle protein [Aggregatilineaceae bacterium]|jgi:hypothetical protein|nr:ClbS/DfsB family four-helix bundle protein [Aggregatilineaceae bacterium]